MVYYNLFTLLSLPPEVLNIRKLVMQLLSDEQLEVINVLNAINDHLMCLTLVFLNHNPCPVDALK